MHCFLLSRRRTMQHMKNLIADQFGVRLRKTSLLCTLLLFLDAPRLLPEPTPAANSAFNTYCAAVESRLVYQHHSTTAFLAAVDGHRLYPGELILEHVTEPNQTLTFPGALLHHWRGTAFAPGAKAADFERLMRDFNSFTQHFSPEVVQASVLSHRGDHIQAAMRIRQHHIITVVMDTTYDIDFHPVEMGHGYSISHSTRITEVTSPGTKAERSLTASEEHGFLWRLNTYWSYEERDSGLCLQIEAVSLSRSIPNGLGWAIAPYVESIPRESLEFTLHSAINALRK
jgi:hypothetical protein